MDDRARILLVDDDESLLRVTEKQLTDAGYEVTAAPGGRAALEAFSPEEVDLVVTDVQMPGMDGLALLREVKRLDSDASVLVITAYGTVESAVEAMKAGAFDFLEKPFRREVLLLGVERALRYRRLEAENARLRRELSEKYSAERFVGESPAMKDVFRTLSRVATSDATVLLRGESGTGKELAARAIHHGGARAEGPFVAVNCAAIPGTLMESELFGHVRGAFTGADSDRRGRFREADGGTIFLDEIGEMSPEDQVVLLRVLEDGEVRPVGAEKSGRVDVRLIAATNRDLDASLEDGTFRRDLYYRIAVVTVEMPPLRNRREDIPLLVDRFLEERGATAVRVTAEFERALLAYSWPGNVRELENVIERALVLLAEPGVLGVGDLPPRIAAPDPDRDFKPELPPEGVSLADVEKDLIRQAMNRTGGNQTRAARLLGITRQTLLYRLEKHGLR
jgi:two-component system NtrC family response regulator